jgi:hypothetical protein
MITQIMGHAQRVFHFEQRKAVVKRLVFDRWFGCRRLRSCMVAY